MESQALWQLPEEEVRGTGEKCDGGPARMVRKKLGFSSLDCPGLILSRHVLIFPIC